MPRDLADEAAQEAPPGLVYVSDAQPGFRRRRAGRGFAFLDTEGRPIRDIETRTRILGLGIPPAWRDVWICPIPHGHIQATGLDEAGRKQYRYHADWQAWRAEVKYGQLAAFGAALPRLRRRVRRDLERGAGDFLFSVAALIMLLDHTHIRVGNRAYAEENGTFGATTLLRRHVTLRDGVVRLRFRAKGGKTVTHTLRDRRLHRIFQEIGDLPGRNLFTYISEDGSPRPVCSHHVNAYVAEAAGVEGLTGKTFRTWAGTLAAFGAAEAAGEGRLTMRILCRAAAETLANTPAICRSSYIHPRVLDLAGMRPGERRAILGAVIPQGPRGLRAIERRLLGLLAA
jgi:DNA topoisomerase-1